MIQDNKQKLTFLGNENEMKSIIRFFKKIGIHYDVKVPYGCEVLTKFASLPSLGQTTQCQHDYILIEATVTFREK